MRTVAAPSCGAGIGGLGTIEEEYGTYLKGSPRKISPFFVPATIVNMISGHLSIKYGLKGPNLGIVTACTTSTHCDRSGDAYDSVRRCRHDHCRRRRDGYDGLRSRVALDRQRRFRHRNDAPTEASRPWTRIAMVLC